MILLAVFAATTTVACSAGEQSDGTASHYDVVIANGQIVDGTGRPSYVGDVGIVDDEIVAIGNLSESAATVRIDAAGKVVTPGFIDMMGQSTLVYIADRPSAYCRLRQGITTHLSGEGWSHAPQNQHTQPEPEDVGDGQMRWQRFSEYFEILQSRGIPLNVVHNVGAAQVRRVVMGDKARVPTADELAAMKALVRQAMEDGAVGLSTSLIYPPGNYASTEELIELAKEVAPYGGTYFTHMRNESHDLLAAIEEAIEIGAGAGVPVHVYHLKAAGKDNWPLMELAIERINAAREDGLNVTADIYPYIRNGIGIRFFIAPSHYADGTEAFMKKLEDVEFRERLRTEIESKTRSWENWYQHVGADWNNVLISRVSDYPDASIAGLSVAEAADRAGVDVWDLFFDLVKANVGVSPKSMDEAQKHLALKTPWVAIVTDSPAANPATVATTHPRAFGAFPRVIARYVREQNVLPLEDAVRRMTALPAEIMGLSDRGRIAPGMAADIAVFDAGKLQDTATFDEPMRYAEGIDYLLVNGRLVIDAGEETGELPGRVLGLQRARASL